MADDDLPAMTCPRCALTMPDFDGFGMQHCPSCGWCSHPDLYGGRCVVCGAAPDPCPDAV